MSKYWKNIKTAASTLKEGLKVTMEHMKDATGSRDAIYTDDENYFEKQNGLFTTQYPKESLPVPDHGRYKLHNEIDDCIVCDKCAKVCPVNCIDIEPVRAVEEIGKTSDGTSKRIYAAKFDIDMAKCCFCGLCTTVCPTECLTMTDEYDFSTYDVAEHNFVFGEMTPLEILQRKQELEEFNKKKAEEKAAKAAAAPKPAAKSQIRPKVGGESDAAAKPKPVFRPKVSVKKPTAEGATESKPKPIIRPKVQVKPKIQVKKPEDKNEEAEASKTQAARPKVQPRPKIPVKKSAPTDSTAESKPRPVIKPKVQVRPKIQVKKKEEHTGEEESPKPKAARPKIPPRPKIPMRKPDNPPSTGGEENKPE